MAGRVNPFVGRASERTTTDLEFVQLFAPKILERIPPSAFQGGIHIFSSPPGGGKTTLFRAFKPNSLRAFWNAKSSDEHAESFQALVATGAIDKQQGPKMLTVHLSCTAGYADFPAGAKFANDGAFRALLNCRVVLRTLRNLATLLNRGSTDSLDDVEISLDESLIDLQFIPKTPDIKSLLGWAETCERKMYEQLDSMTPGKGTAGIVCARFEGVLWLQGVKFRFKDTPVAPLRVLMIDDVQRLQRRQRTLLLEELVELRSHMPVWIAQRSYAYGTELIAQGVREERDIERHDLEELWNVAKSPQQFQAFVQNVLDRRFKTQLILPGSSFASYLRQHLEVEEIDSFRAKALAKFREAVVRFRNNERYIHWIANADHLSSVQDGYEALRDLFVTTILLNRDEKSRQLTLELEPLSAEELGERTGSDIRGAAEVFLHSSVGAPYYYGIEKICALASGNIEEALGLAASLYEALTVKQIVSNGNIVLSPAEQERAIKRASKRKRDFIPAAHTQGTRAQALVDAIGHYCLLKTLEPTAPYAPGLTGVRLSSTQLRRVFGWKTDKNSLGVLADVLAECVAENLLLTRESSASGSREAGTVFYLNRTLCALYGLPIQFGGWNDVSAEELARWMGSSLGSRDKDGLAV